MDPTTSTKPPSSTHARPQTAFSSCIQKLITKTPDGKEKYLRPLTSAANEASKVVSAAKK